MTVWEIIIIAVGLSLDVYAYCLYKGAMLSEIRKTDLLKMAGLFTGFQVAAMALGSMVRMIPPVEKYIERAQHFATIFSAILFFVLAVIMLLKALWRKDELIMERKEDTYNYRLILLWCTLASIDSLIAGASFSLLSIDLLAMLLIVGLVSALAVVLGIYIGYRVGCEARNSYLTIGGFILIAGGVDVLIRYFI